MPAQRSGTSVETSAQSEISPEDIEPTTVENSQTGENTSELKERDGNVVKLTTKDLEDLEKIQEELDSLTSYLPANLQAPNAAIHMKTDGLIDDQDQVTAALESSISVETQSVNTDSAKITSIVSDSIPVINNVISLSTTMSPTIGSTSGTNSEEHNITSGVGGIKTLKLAPKPIASTPSVVIQTSTASVVGSVATTHPITQTCVVSGLPSAYKTETISGLQRLQQPHGSTTVTPLLGPLTAMKGSDVKVILPQTSNPTQATLVSLPQLATNNSVQAALKRTPCSTVTNQVITKVIITSNPATNQSGVAPLAGPLSAAGTGTLITNDSLVGQQSTILLASPTKTFTTSKPVVNTAGTPRIIRSVPSTPPKQGVVVLSRVKSGKVSSPISFVKSPQRIAPAPNTGSYSSIISGSKVTIVTATAAVSTPTLSTSIAKPITIPTSPTKVILKPVVQTMKPTPGIITNQSSATVSSIDTSLKQMLPVTGNTVQQIQVPGSKFHYVRLVTAPAAQSGSVQGTKQATLIPVTRPSTTSCHDSPSVVNVSSGAAVRLTLPITPLLSPQSQVSAKPTSTPQRMLIPASNVTSVSQVRTSNSIPTMAIRQLSTGALLQAGSGILMVPAQYNITQLQQTSQNQSNAIAPTPMVIQSVQPQNILPSPTPGNSSGSSVQQANFVPVAPATANQLFEQSSSQNLLSSLPRHHINGRSAEIGESRLRKPCNCTKSQCLKLYCDCFANGEFCNHCNCNNCANNLKHEEERQKAIKACLDRNPLAFHPKIGKGRDGVHERRHTKGCNCKRSGCLKNYCECYEAKILCTNLCKCIGCKNFEDSSERKTLMHLADAAEVRVQQQTAAKTKISSQIQDLPTRPPIISTTGERLPFAFVTQEVVEATCQCLLAQSEDGEKSKMPVSTLERLVLEEFGRCLMQIIEYANRTKVSNT